MARILFVNQYYWPDVASSGQHLSDLAEHLVACGHEVRVLCSRGTYVAGAPRSARREIHRGVEIRRVGATAFAQRTRLGRLVNYAGCHALIGLRAACGRWADLVVCLTTPPLLGIWSALGRSLGGAPFVYWCMDLHPDAEFALGWLRPKGLPGRVLEALNAWALRRAQRVVSLGNYQAQRVLDKGVDPERLRVVPVWSRAEEIVPLPHEENTLREQLGWKNRFVAMYSGNAGLAHRFEEMLDAAQFLQQVDPQVLFAFVGAGPRQAEIQSEVQRRQLGNVQVLGYFPRADLRFSLAAADAHLLSLRPQQVGISVPGKLYGCLASGRPTIFVGAERCESADSLRQAQAGICLRPGEGRKLAQTLLAWKRDPQQREALGRSARAYFLEHHERLVCCESWREELENLVGGAQAPGAAQLRMQRQARLRREARLRNQRQGLRA